jgi:hypothetical protein
MLASAISTVRFGPIKSSTQPKAKAPRPAVTLSAMPNSSSSSKSMPNVTAA